MSCDIILLVLTVLVILGEECKYEGPHMLSPPPFVTSFLFGPNILPSILFSNTASLESQGFWTFPIVQILNNGTHFGNWICFASSGERREKPGPITKS
jgi:hypothetical protein